MRVCFVHSHHLERERECVCETVSSCSVCVCVSNRVKLYLLDGEGFLRRLHL